MTEKLIVHCQLTDDLEQLFTNELNETHKKSSELLRAIISEHYQFKNNPLSFLFALPEFKKLLSLKAEVDLVKEKEQAKQETLKMQEQIKRDRAKDRALSQHPKVDWGNVEGGAVITDNTEQFSDGFALGDR